MALRPCMRRGEYKKCNIRPFCRYIKGKGYRVRKDESEPASLLRYKG